MLNAVEEKFGHVPYMTLAQARKLNAFIGSENLENLLELGFFHGKSSAFLAATLKELGRGHLTTIDLEPVRDKSPNIEGMLGALGLAEWVTVHYEPRSFTWRLMRMLEADPTPRFDFCYLDAGHSWDSTGMAFFLIDRLLVPGGWLLFDDLHWTYGAMQKPGEEMPSWLARMTQEERDTPQVLKIWELLVKTHPNYGAFREDGQWAFARKSPGAGRPGQRHAAPQRPWKKPRLMPAIDPEQMVDYLRDLADGLERHRRASRKKDAP